MTNRFLLFTFAIIISSVSYADKISLESLPSKVTQEMSGIQPKLSGPHPFSVKKSTDKYVWMARMQKALPASLCEENQYFLTCFNTDKEECQKLASVYLSACLDNAVSGLPSKLTAEQQTYWGYTMGRCTYDLYNTFMTDVKKKDPRCSQSNPEKPEAKSQTKPKKPESKTETK
jgi:hypothetical protein